MSKQPKIWRPASFADIVGKKNQEIVKRVQLYAIKRSLLILLLIGPYGSGKTALARLLMASYCCHSPDETTADPCNTCENCCQQGPDYNGVISHRYHWEIECNQALSQEELPSVVLEARQTNKIALFVDELGRLKERNGQEALLKFVEDRKEGLIVGAVGYNLSDSSSNVQIIPPLYERMRKEYLSIPTTLELVSFFSQKAKEWEIQHEISVLKEMVKRSQNNFRICLDILDMAFQYKPRKLSTELLEAFLPPIQP